MTISQIYRLEKGSQIMRKPDGYACSVMQVDLPGERVRIFDAHATSVFWCVFTTLLRNWRVK
jgi:hypothetical protein